MDWNGLKYRDRLTITIDKNILKEFRALSKRNRQPMSWLMDDALEMLLAKNGIQVTKAGDEKEQ